MQIRDQRNRTKKKYPRNPRTIERRRTRRAAIPTPNAGVNRYLGAWSPAEDIVAFDPTLTIPEKVCILGRSPQAIGNRKWKIRTGRVISKVIVPQ